jgi:hypothetical protein
MYIRNMRWIIVSIAYILTFQTADAQSLMQNQTKYWAFRDSFLQKFIVVGEGQGKSLPAVSRHDNYERIGWGDATLHLGWYMAVLSTEYALLASNSDIRVDSSKVIEKEQTLLELFYALKAIERLDLNAEPFFSKSAKPDLNGFFIRDDVPTDIISHFPGMNAMQSDFTKEDSRANEESQDQVHHLLMGLMCIKEFIPAAAQVKGDPLVKMANANGKRILDYMKKNNWHVLNPVLTKSNGKEQKVLRGGEGYIYSGGSKYILRKVDPEVKKEKINPLYNLFWSSLRMGINPTYVKDDNAHMALAVATSGNGFKKNTYRKLSKRAKANDWYVYPLLNLALYPDNRRFKKENQGMARSRALLDIAPTRGPHSTYPDPNTHGWTVNNRFMRSYSELFMNKPHTIGAEYAGLDYMLLHNLYLMHLKGLVKSTDKK